MEGENISDLTIKNLNVPKISGFKNGLSQIKPLILNDTLKIYSRNDEPDSNNELHSNNLAIYDNAKDSFVNIFSDNGTLKYNDYSLLNSDNLISELNNNIDDFELTVNRDTNSLDYLNISNLKILGNDFDDASSTTYKVYVTINDDNKGGGVNASSISIGNTSTIGVNPLTKALSQNDIITFFNGAKFTLTQNSGLNATEITGQLTINTIATGQIGTIDKTEEISTNIPYLNFTSESGENGHGLRYNPTTGQVQYKNLGGAGWTNISAAFLDIKLSCVIATTENLASVYNQITIDSTTNSKNIYNSNSATYTSNHRSVSNKALNFNGTSNYATIPHSFSNVKSISFWFYPTSAAQQNLFYLSSTEGIEYNGGEITITGLTSTTIYINGETDPLILDINDWYHIVVTTDTDFTTDNPFYIGVKKNSSNPDVFANYFQGRISDVRFYDTVLSSANITSIYNSDTILGNELAIYKFEKDNDNLGVGDTLISNNDGAFPVIDGVTLNTTGKRILVKDQTDKKQNGIYQLSTVGDENTPWVLTRTTDADTPAKLNAGAFTVIEFGTQKGNSYTFLTENTNTDTVVIGTTQFIISIIGSASAITGINNPGPNKLLAFNNTSNTILDGQDNLTFDGTNLVVVGNTKTNTVKSQAAGTGLDIQFNGNQDGLNKISLTDNLSDALNITEDTNSYMQFITTDGSEQIVFGKNTTFSNTTIADLGTVTTADINGGTIGGVTFDGAINCGNQDMTNVDINSGTIDATTIGATTPSSGIFTELTISENFLVNREEAEINTAGNQTYFIANLKKGLIRRDCGGSSVSDIIDTAANIVAGLTNAQVGTSFEFVVENNSDSDETITITGGSGITLYGNMTIKQNKAKSFLAVITNIGGGTEAVSIYQLGGGGGDLNDLGDVELNTNKNGTYGLPVYGPDQDGNANQALTFDGLDDYVNIPYSFSGIKSVSIWFYPTSVSQQTIIYLKSDTYIEINISAQINAQGFTSPTIYVNKSTSPSTLSINTWYHVVVTTATSITIDNNDNDVLIGKRDTTFFEGSISDVRLYNNELTQTNVNDIYDNNLIGLEQAHYKFDQATDSDNIAVDQGDFVKHANIITSPGYTTDKDDGENQALSFNGENNYVNIPHIVSGIKSISLRIYADDVTQQTLVYLNSTTYIEINSSAQINARGFAATPNIYLNNVAETVTNSGSDNNGSSTLSIITWYHIVVTTETAIATDNPFYFAKGATTYYFDGKISDVRFHNSVLNGDDITLLFNNDNEIIGNEIVHYRMNEENGSNVNDSVNSNLYIANTPLNAIVGKAVFNSSIGIQALNNIQIGEGNLAIGYQALNSLVTGFNNIALGTFAGKNIINSSDNIFIGKDSGRYCKSGYNTFVGAYSGKSDPNNQLLGAYNTCLGNLSGQNIISSAAQNTFIGSYAGFGEIGTGLSGSDNVCIGYYSGFKLKDSIIENNLISSRENTFIGSYSGQNTTTSLGNVFIGYKSGNSNTEGYGNTFIGLESGALNQTGYNNTVLGYSANVNGIDAQNQIVIGYGAISKGNNTVVLGNDDITDVFCARDGSAKLHCREIEARGPTGTGSACAGVITLSTAETSIGVDDKLGQINFQAPLESDEGDSRLTGASIYGIAEGTFDASNNKTGLVFATAATGGFEEKMRLQNDGMLKVTEGIKLGKNSFNQHFLSADEAAEDTNGEIFVIRGSSPPGNSGAADTGQGGNLKIQAGQGKGTAVGGDIIFKTAPPGNSGTNLNSSTTALTISGTDSSSSFDAPIKLKERASALGDTASYGQLWVKTATPNELYFNNIQITSGTGLNAGSSNLDSLTDVKFGGTNFTNSLFIGNNSPGSAPQHGSLSGAEKNLAILPDALKSLTSGKNNIALGYKTLEDLTTSLGNVAIGTSSLSNNTANYNTAIGYESGNANNTGNDNVFIGNTSGNTNETGSNNICIGSAANVNGSNSTNQIVIGCNATGVGDRTVVLGDDQITDVYCGQNGDAKVRAGGFISDITTDSISGGGNKLIDFTESVNFYFTMENGPFTTNFSSPTTNGSLQGQSGQIFIKNDASNPSTITWEVSKGWCFESDSGGNIIVPNITGVANAIDVFNYIILEDSATAANRRILITKASHFQHYT